MKAAVPCPELTLRPKDRRKRARHLARMKAGTNALTKRQVRRLSNSVRRAWKAQRAARKQGWASIHELMAA